jgi:glutathione S-transferase
LVPANGTTCRYKLINALGFVNSELHPGIGGFFGAKTDEQKAAQKVRADAVTKKFEALLAGGKQFLVGDGLTIADIYAHIVLGWTAYVGFDLKPYPATEAYLARIRALPAIVEAQKVVATKPASL